MWGKILSEVLVLPVEFHRNGFGETAPANKAHIIKRLWRRLLIFYSRQFRDPKTKLHNAQLILSLQKVKSIGFNSVDARLIKYQ